MKPYRHHYQVLSGAFLILLATQISSEAIAQEKKAPLQPPVAPNIIAQTPTIEIKDTQPGLNRSSSPPPPVGQPTYTQTNPPNPSQPNPNVEYPDPTILIDGQPVPPGGNAPPQPYLPRAVAPPVGDMAVSNIDASLDKIDLGTIAIVPRMVLKQAPVREVLISLARFANLNVVFIDDQPTTATSTSGQTVAPVTSSTLTMDLSNEPLQEVFNSVLLLSGLQANRRGNTIYVGAKLPDGARNLISRTIRLNQVNSNLAATFLASQGAEVQQLVIPVTEVRDPVTNRVLERRQEAAKLEPITAERPEGDNSPLLLNGLKAAPDSRLNSMTLIGEPRKVEIATSFLTQLDARRRQVAINVKVVDINLSNIERFSSSFSFGFDDGFVVQDQGTGILNFGGQNPPTAQQATGSIFYPTIVPLQVPGAGAITPFFDRQLAPFGDVTRGVNDFSNTVSPYSRASFGTNNNPFQPGVSDVQVDDTGRITYEYQIPNLYQYPQKFLLTLQSQIESGNAKILTDPTLVVQEGQEATVQLTQQVLSSITSSIDVESGVRTVTPVISDAGLVLNVNIERIDDNGFINFTVNPTISAPGDTTSFSSGIDATNQITLLNTRALNSGLMRLRDGQTLIVSGIIQESDRATVSKVPVLGDLPLLGALFRRTENTTERREVIILLTPQIIEENSGFGYNYRPGPEAAKMLKQQGFPIQGTPSTQP